MDISKISGSSPANQMDYNRTAAEKTAGVESINDKVKEGNVSTGAKKEDLDHAVKIANNVLFKNNTHLQFRIHDKTQEVMVKIIDDETGEVVKEIPPEKMLDMVAKLWEIAGIIVDERR